MKYLRLLILLILLVAPAIANATDYWDLVNTAIDATGYSEIMYGDKACTNYAIFIKTSGTVSMTAAIKVSPTDIAVASMPTTNTYTFTTAAWQQPLTVPGPVPKMVVYFTITTGQVDDMRVYCAK